MWNIIGFLWWGDGGGGVVLKDSDCLVLIQYGVTESALDRNFSFFFFFFSLTQVTNSSIEVNHLEPFI